MPSIGGRYLDIYGDRVLTQSHIPFKFRCGLIILDGLCMELSSAVVEIGTKLFP